MSKDIEVKIIKDSDMKDSDMKYPPEPINWPPFSINNRLILEVYKTDRGLKATERNGFAMISQKVTVKGLKVLIDAHLYDGDSQTSMRIPRGSLAYIREEYLHTQPWAQKIMESDAIGEQFIIVDIKMVEFIKQC